MELGFPADRQGFVSPVLDEDDNEVVHNLSGTPFDADVPALTQFFRSRMKGPPEFLKRIQAEPILKQFQETAQHRHWLLLAVAVMVNHVHVVVSVAGDPSPSNILRDFKSYASRVLNRNFEKPKNGTWWTELGSKRKLRDEQTVFAAVRYVKDQARPLVIWITDDVCGEQRDQQGADAPRSPKAACRLRDKQ